MIINERITTKIISFAVALTLQSLGTTKIRDKMEIKRLNAMQNLLDSNESTNVSTEAYNACLLMIDQCSGVKC